MFVNEFSAILFSIGPLQIRFYSLVYLFGFIALYFLMNKAEEKKWIKGYKKIYTDSFISYMFLGLLIGARTFHVFAFGWADGTNYFTNFWTSIGPIPFPRFLAVWNGGLSFHGAVVGMGIALYLFTRKHKLKFYDFADFLVIPGSFFLIFGRLANFVNSELAGRITTVPWCVQYPNAVEPSIREGCRHPTQIYEMIKNIFLFSGLTYLWKERKKLPSGTIFWSFIGGYGIIRFFIMFYRQENIVLLGMTMSQILSGLMFVVAAYVLAKNWDK